jgi:hypothetical protein
MRQARCGAAAEREERRWRQARELGERAASDCLSGALECVEFDRDRVQTLDEIL